MNTKDCAMLGPCPKCPFRSDVVPFITAARAASIWRSISAGESFSCHKTTTHDDDGERVQTSNERMCAGAVILARREGVLYRNQMVRIGERLGANYDDVRESAPIYRTAAAMISAHKKQKAMQP